MTLNLKRLTRLVIVFVLVLVIDIATKYLTQRYIPLMKWSAFDYPYGGIPVFKDFLGIDLSINHVINRGGPWGVISSYHSFLLVMRIIAVVCLTVHLLFFNEVKFRQMPLLLIIAGAVGNILDSFFYGHVVDMIHFVFWDYSFPLFNVADASICFGVGLIVLQAFLTKVKSNKTNQSLNSSFD